MNNNEISITQIIVHITCTESIHKESKMRRNDDTSLYTFQIFKSKKNSNINQYLNITRSSLIHLYLLFLFLDNNFCNFHTHQLNQLIIVCFLLANAASISESGDEMILRSYGCKNHFISPGITTFPKAELRKLGNLAISLCEKFSHLARTHSSSSM